MHQHGTVHGRAANRNLRVFTLALGVTAAFALIELVGGLLTGSLALVADAGHMSADALALALSLVAAWLAAHPTTPRNTFGYLRAEVLAALGNGALLVAIAAVTIWEAARRLIQPPAVHAGPVILIATLGLLVNALVALLLVRAGRENLNARAALLDALSDSVSAGGTIVAAAVLLATGWRRADAIASIGIATLIVVAAWRLLSEVVQVLLEGTPRDIDLAQVVQAMLGVPGVHAVHDVHVWTVTSGFVAMSGHAELDDCRDSHDVLDELTQTLATDFHIGHVTIQSESGVHAADCCDVACEPEPKQPALASHRH